MKSPNLTRRAAFTCIFILALGMALGWLDGRLSVSARMDGSLRLVVLSAVQAFLLLSATRYLNRSAARWRAGRDKPISRRFRIGWLPVAIFAGLSATLGGILLNAAVAWIPWLGGFSGELTRLYADKSGAALFVSVVLLPAVSEELFFRGAVLSAYRNRSYGAAVAGSALLFALLHASALNFLAPLFAGVVYALITLFYQSVYPAVLAHILNNALTLLIYMYEERIRALGLGGYLLFFVLILFFLCSYMALRLADKHLPKLKLPEQSKGLSARVQKSAFSPLLSMPFLVLVLLWLARAVMTALGCF